ncbi:MAG: hypothetical protein HRO68_05535 [Nitrosopumilus sp.]|nr:hypothetical protein [Nitrosopumilus sp.]
MVVVDGFDEESGEGLVASGKISLVTSSDDSRFETKAGYYTDYYLTNTIVPVGATSITSLIFYVEHNEESSFGVGNLVWLTDSNTVSTTPTLIIDNDGTTSWDVPVGSITPADVNSLVFRVQNNDVANGKLTKVDYIYADVDWLE